ncbi:PAS domain-containing protein [Streptomyces manipurensis]|uniref:PAS domain-containing protein n=1 Tax=Streptomyces manipurensis TaxID=1077945 RepID=UPI003C6EBC08
MLLRWDHIGRADRPREVLDGARAGIALLDTDLRYLYVSPHMAVMKGVPARAMLGRTLGEVLPDVERPDEVLRQVLRDGRPRELILEGRTHADSPYASRDVPPAGGGRAGTGAGGDRAGGQRAPGAAAGAVPHQPAPAPAGHRGGAGGHHPGRGHDLSRADRVPGVGAGRRGERGAAPPGPAGRRPAGRRERAVRRRGRRAAAAGGRGGGA